MRKALKHAKECTTCDMCGGRLTIPPGVYYRGRRMHKQEAERWRRIDFDNEVTAPHLNDVLMQLNSILSRGTPP
jgi:hypothetical protein